MQKKFLFCCSTKRKNGPRNCGGPFFYGLERFQKLQHLFLIFFSGEIIRFAVLADLNLDLILFQSLRSDSDAQRIADEISILKLDASSYNILNNRNISEYTVSEIYSSEYDNRIAPAYCLLSIIFRY
jgi:hypothetical protein